MAKVGKEARESAEGDSSGEPRNNPTGNPAPPPAFSSPFLIRLGLTIALVIALLDQLSKWAVMSPIFGLSYWSPVQGFPWAGSIEILPFFNLVTVWNQGVSFGLFSDETSITKWLLVAVTSAIAIGMTVWLTKVSNRWLAVSLGLVIGGAVGNIIDRLRFGAVFDFLDVIIVNYHWPAFNVADAAITIGAVLILIEGFFEPKTSHDIKLTKK